VDSPSIRFLNFFSQNDILSYLLKHIYSYVPLQNLNLINEQAHEVCEGQNEPIMSSMTVLTIF
jgi:hypothetical protein